MQPNKNTHGLFWIEDGGHAWLAVCLRTWPHAINYGTGYGYQDADMIYLEEDCEAPAFLDDHEHIAGHVTRGEIARAVYDFDAPVRGLARNEARLGVIA